MKFLLYINCLVYSFLLSMNIVNAQEPCNDGVIMAVKGKWTTSGDNIVGPDKTFPASQYSQIKTRLTRIAGFFQEAYPQPAGMEAKWYRSIRGNAIVNNGPVPYQFNSLYKAWYCNQNIHKLLLGGETGTWAYVFVNDLHWFTSDIESFKIDGATAYLLPIKIGQWKGMNLYDCGSTTSKEHRAVLITRGDQLPYKPVSRLQYLQSLKNKIETDKKIQLDINRNQPVKTDSEEEVVKQKGMENIAKNNRPERVAQRQESYLKNYKTDKQRKEETIQKMEKHFNDILKPVEVELNNKNRDELQKPAIVHHNNINSFKEFATEENGGRMIVIINNNYFNMQLPRYAPQLMVLYWRSESNNNEPSQYFKKKFEANFPVEKLKSMIDK